MKRSRLEDGTLAGYIHERSEVDVPGIKLVFDSVWKAVPPIIYLEVVPSSHRLHLVIFRAHVRFAPMYLVYEVLPYRQFRCIPCGKRRRLHPFPKKYSKKFGHTKEKQYLCTRLQEARAFSSVGLEHLPYKQRVGGSNPSTPTGVFPCGPSGPQGYFFVLQQAKLLPQEHLSPDFSFFCGVKDGRSHNFIKFANIKNTYFSFLYDT